MATPKSLREQNKQLEIQEKKYAKIIAHQEKILASAKEGSAEHKKANGILDVAQKKYDQIAKKQIEIGLQQDENLDTAEKIREVEKERSDLTRELDDRYRALSKSSRQQLGDVSNVTDLTHRYGRKMKEALELQDGIRESTKNGVTTTEDLTKTYNTSLPKLKLMGELQESAMKTQDKSALLTLEMAENWDKVGTSDYVNQLDKVKALEEEAAAERRKVNDIISAGNYPAELEKKLLNELAITEAAIEEAKAKAFAQDRSNKVALSGTQAILSPLVKVKGALEALPFGQVISDALELDTVFQSMGEDIGKVLGDVAIGTLDSGDGFDQITDIASGGIAKLQEGFTNLTGMPGAMLGPLMLVVGVIMLAAKVAKIFYGGIMDTRKELGVTVAEAGKLQSSINTTALEFSLLGVSAEDVAGISDSIRDNMGGLSSATSENISAMTQLTALYGISGENTGILAAQMMAVGASSVDAATSQMESVALLARANGVAPAAVMNDVAGSADAFAGFAKEGGENVFKAAIAARKLGLDMAAVEQIADSLLDFESSINAQMEASMLIGRNINTDKARELALAGDLEGMQKEVTKQIGSAADFEKLNVVQRKSLAAAFGVSVSELGKMVANQDKLNNMTEAEKGHRDKMAKVMEFLGKAWAGFLSVGKALLPVVVGLGVALAVAFWPITLALTVITGIGMLFNELNKKVPMLGTVLGVILGLMTAIWMKSKLAGEEMSGGMMEGAKNMAKGLKERLMGGGKGGDKGGGVVDKIKEKFTGGDKTKAVKKPAPGKGKKGGGMMESMFGKDSKIDYKKMIQGAAAMLIVAVAMFVIAKALQEFGDVDGESIAMAGVTLLGLTVILAILGKLKGQLIQGAVAMLIMSVALIPFAFALQMLSAVDYGKVALAGVTLIALTAAMFLLGALLAGPGAIIFGAGVIGMIALGGALIILGVGLMSVGQGMKIIGSIVEPLKQLASIVAPLFKLSTAFAALGYSMGVMALGALTLLPALPVLMTLAALGMMGGAVLGIGGKGAAAVGGEEVSPVELKLDSTNAKLDTLIGLMGKEGVMAQNLQGIKRNTGGFIDQIATA